MTTVRSVGVVSQFDSSFRTALGNTSLEAVDLETLERLEQSPEVDCFLDPAAPKILYTLVQSHMNSRPNSRIFDDQYGLVCVRILIRLVQVIVCQNSDTLSYVRESMGGAAANTSILAFLSGHTVDVIQRQMGQSHNNNSLKTISEILGKSKDLFTRDHISKLLGLLWQDRKSFFVLFKNGSLQGIVLLLYMVWVQISGIMSEMDEFLMARLRDLLFRCYLVTDAQERHTIRLLCIQMYHLYNGHDDESHPFDLEDSRAMVHAYNQCIMFSADPDPLGGMKLDMYRYLLEFVTDVTVLPMQEELPLVIRAAIERLWLAFDTENIEPLITPDDPRSQTMYYFGDLSYALSQFLSRVRPKHRSKAVVEALVQSNWPEVMARYMLHCFRKPVIMTFPTFTMRYLPAVTTMIAEFGHVPYEAFADTYPDWLKILSYLRLLIGSRDPGDPAIAHVGEVVEEWRRWGMAVGFEQSPFETDCAYPRCVGGLSAYVCGRCGTARYCSIKCQRANWLSSFPDSHQRFCQAKKPVNV